MLGGSAEQTIRVSFTSGDFLQGSTRGRGFGQVQRIPFHGKKRRMGVMVSVLNFIDYSGRLFFECLMTRKKRILVLSEEVNLH